MAKYEFVRPFSTHAVGDVVELPDNAAVASYLKPVVENTVKNDNAVVVPPKADDASAPDADKEGN